MCRGLAASGEVSGFVLFLRVIDIDASVGI